MERHAHLLLFGALMMLCHIAAANANVDAMVRKRRLLLLG
jgi:hypothetical protein